MNPVALWRVYAELPLPTLRPHDHHARLHQALTARPEIISAETLILGAAGQHYVAATMVLAAPDDSAASLAARQALQQACAVARLPTGPLRAIKTERQCGPAPGPAT
jgi:hypothetical protein